MMPRRFTVVGVAIVMTALLLHKVLSSALVTRGDDLTYAGNVLGALQKYSLAHFLNRSDAVATDRYAFTAIRSHNASLLLNAIVMIEETPANGRQTLVMDRALCLHLLGRYADAAAAFERAGRVGRDGRAMFFAALDEKRVNRTAKARKLLALAMFLEPNFKPAHEAYARSSRW